jgi:hypothetical protein
MLAGRSLEDHSLGIKKAGRSRSIGVDFQQTSNLVVLFSAAFLLWVGRLLMVFTERMAHNSDSSLE